MSGWRRLQGPTTAVLIAMVVAAWVALAVAEHQRGQANAAESMGASAVWVPDSQAPEVDLQPQGGNSQDVLEKALLTVGVAAAAGFVALVGYAIRRRVGFWMHRPETGEDGSSEEHH